MDYIHEIGKRAKAVSAQVQHLSQNQKNEGLRRVAEHLTDNTPDYLLKIIGKVIAVLLHKLNLPDEEVYDITDQITWRKFSMMFDNFQAYDVQETRRVSREEGRIVGKMFRVFFRYIF